MVSNCVAVLGAATGVALLVGLLSGGGVVFTVMHSMKKPTGKAIMPRCPACGACMHKDLRGRFVGNVSASKTVLGHKIVTSYTMSHTFRDKGVDVNLVPIQSPFNMLKGFTCTGVPFKVNSSTCELTLGNDCTEKSYTADDVHAMHFLWDGFDNISVVEDLRTPFFSQTYVWSEVRQNDQAQNQVAAQSKCLHYNEKCLSDTDCCSKYCKGPKRGEVFAVCMPNSSTGVRAPFTSVVKSLFGPDPLEDPTPTCAPMVKTDLICHEVINGSRVPVWCDDLAQVPATDPAACCAMCLANHTAGGNCSSWSYNFGSKLCYLKARDGKPANSTDTSGHLFHSKPAWSLV